jgi:hypothetical protein
MCRELDALRQSILVYASGFDARSLTPAAAGQVMRVCAQIEASVASVKALAVARCAEGQSWQQEGYRSAAHQLAAQTGMSPSAAKRALETGRRLGDQPEVAKAALAGELSPEQADAVSDGVAANPSKAGELIDKAKHLSVPELNDEVARTKAAATDQEARRRAIHARRSLRRWTDRDGAFQAHLYGHPEDGAGLWRMLDPLRRRLNMIRRDPTTSPNGPNGPNGSREALEALDYDALILLASIATGHDGELGLTDLLDLGLFPQLDPTTIPNHTNRTPPTPPAPSPTPHSATAPPTTPPTAPTTAPTTAPSGSDAPDLFTLFAGSDPTDGETDPPDPPDPPGPPGPPGPAGPARPVRRAKKLAGSPARIMIRVDLDTLLRGFPIEGELCEIAGYGPIPVSVIQDLIANENAFIVGLLTKSEQLIGVYHHRRRPNAHQQSALDFIYPGCAAAGCPARAGLQYDHRQDWAKTKFTAFDLLDRLCPHHHALKTRKNWALVAGTGKRPFVAPDHPQHPRNTTRPPVTRSTSPSRSP